MTDTDTAPSPWLRQHVELVDATEIAGVARRRVQRPLERYQVRGYITSRQAAAGDRLYCDWQESLGVRDRDGIDPAVRMPYGPRDYPPAQIDAGNRTAAAMAAVGKRLSGLVTTVVMEEVYISTILPSLRMSVEAAMALLRHALDLLADHYGMPE